MVKAAGRANGVAADAGGGAGGERQLEAAIQSFLASVGGQAARGTRTSKGQEDAAGAGRVAAARLRNLGCRARDVTAVALARIVPALLTAFASALAYGAGLGAGQLLGAQLRVSCARRIVAPLMGALSAGGASALAGHVSRHMRRALSAQHTDAPEWRGKGRRGQERTGTVNQPQSWVQQSRQLLGTLLSQPLWCEFDAQQGLLDAVMGMVMLKVFGGEFRRLMPSDLRYPGAFALNSMPAAGAHYANRIQREKLNSLLKQDGCHSCGIRRGPVIGDHQPPNKVVELLRMEQRTLADAHKALPLAFQQVREWIGAFRPNAPLPQQAYFPQCTACSSRQGAVLRGQVSSSGGTPPAALVMHLLRQPRPGLLPGVLIGAMQGYPNAASACGDICHHAPAPAAALTMASLPDLGSSPGPVLQDTGVGSGPGVQTVPPCAMLHKSALLPSMTCDPKCAAGTGHSSGDFAPRDADGTVWLWTTPLDDSTGPAGNLVFHPDACGALSTAAIGKAASRYFDFGSPRRM